MRKHRIDGRIAGLLAGTFVISGGCSLEDAPRTSAEPAAAPAPAPAGVTAPRPAAVDTQLSWDERVARTTIVRLPLDSFPNLPAEVRAQPSFAGCLVPQPGGEGPGPHNVISGSLAASGQIDWALLCSRNDSSRIEIAWGGPVQCPRLGVPHADNETLQGWTENRLVFSSALGYATIERIEQKAKDYGGPAPPARNHGGLEVIAVGKASVIYFCHQGKWVRLQGAD